MSDSKAKMRASIIGGSGYTGGELARLLLAHPSVELAQISSRSLCGQPLHRSHPNLRGRSELLFCSPQEVGVCDVLFLCLPHGQAAPQVDRYLELAPVVIDLSADLRLRDPARYERWYGEPHPAPARLAQAIYGLPELRRNDLAAKREGAATIVSGVGCNATAMNLALLPLARAGLIERAVCDIKVGSSEAGAEPSAGSHHPERSGAVRSYAPAGHRHAAEVEQELGARAGRDGEGFALDVSITAIEMVRGVLCTAHVFSTRQVDTKELWKLYRAAYRDEPFVRIVCEKSGLHRLPDPKILAGTNYCDVGFEVDPNSGRIVVISALDSLMKGAAGTAVQCMNLTLGLPETSGLEFAGLHPI